jgi:hypothetical protein
MIKAVKINGRNFIFASKNLKKDKDVVLAAVK